MFGHGGHDGDAGPVGTDDFLLAPRSRGGGGGRETDGRATLTGAEFIARLGRRRLSQQARRGRHWADGVVHVSYKNVTRGILHLDAAHEDFHYRGRQPRVRIPTEIFVLNGIELLPLFKKPGRHGIRRFICHSRQVAGEAVRR